ncbi:MAG TPA: Bax inhibitor-1 family protein [Pirellulales bacterium]|jgi:hypothetical protein|nr:Bax inhibitor-1 family protein [Pirellulales bacterium]
MDYSNSNVNPYRSPWGDLAANAQVDERTDFIRKTYLHLLCAILAFAGLETILMSSPTAVNAMNNMLMGGRGSAIVALIAFLGISWLANYWALNSTSKGLQYLGLSLYVVAEALIFMPILYFADKFYPGQQIISTAGTITLVLFGGLTGYVLLSKKDFSFLGGFLTIGMFAVIGLALCSMLFGFHLGMVYTVAVIGLACGYILYDTSNVLHRYRIGQHVAASLALFASVALLFMYVLRLLMELNGSRR